MVAIKIFQQQKTIKYLWPAHCDKSIANKETVLTSDKSLWELCCFAFARMLDSVNEKKNFEKLGIFLSRQRFGTYQDVRLIDTFDFFHNITQYFF